MKSNALRIFYIRCKVVIQRMKPWKGMMAYEIQVLPFVFQWFHGSIVLKKKWEFRKYWWPSEASPKRVMAWRFRIRRFQIFYDPIWWKWR